MERPLVCKKNMAPSPFYGTMKKYSDIKYKTSLKKIRGLIKELNRG